MFNFVKKINNKVRHTIEVNKYNNFTICKYFRKQGAQIGKDCYIVPRSLGTEPYLVKIGDHVAIAEGVKFHTHDGGTWVFRGEMPDLRIFGPIIIEDNCLIGAYAQIMPNVKIGKNSIISSGSVVISDIPANSIAIGIPARVISSMEKYKEKCIQNWNMQKPPGMHAEIMKHYDEIENREEILRRLRYHLESHFKSKLIKEEAGKEKS